MVEVTYCDFKLHSGQQWQKNKNIKYKINNVQLKKKKFKDKFRLTVMIHKEAITCLVWEFYKNVKKKEIFSKK